MVLCPICSKEVDVKSINQHLDRCEIENKKKTENQKLDIKANEEESSFSSQPEPQTQSGHTKSVSSILMRNNRKSPVNKERPRSYQYSPASPPPSLKRSIDDQEFKSESQLLLSPTVSSKRQKPSALDTLRITCNLPLSERLRPHDLVSYIGQSHLVGPRGILRGYLNHGRIPSLILWGHPGTGKTTLARILGKASGCRVVEMSGVMHGVGDCKKVFEEASNEIKLTKKPTVVFVDEIHRFSKSQQDVFLGYVERGIIILIGATTENPSFNVNKALLSRCRVFVLDKLNNEEMLTLLTKGIVEINKVRKLIYQINFLKISKESIEWIIGVADGDGRLALGCLELIDSHFSDSNDNTAAKTIDIGVDDVKRILKKSTVLYDRVGDAHYDTISAFHKSIRGSNPDAAMYYLARMLKGGEDPLYIARRMIRIASEDIGVLDDSCLPFATSVYQAVQFVGLPDADLALVHCAVKLARAPKSIEIYRGWNEMKSWMNEPGVEGAEIPLHLRNAPTKLMSDLGYSKNYKYNPNFKHGKVKQTYFPENIGEKVILKGKHLGDIIDPDL